MDGDKSGRGGGADTPRQPSPFDESETDLYNPSNIHMSLFSRLSQVREPTTGVGLRGNVADVPNINRRTNVPTKVYTNSSLESNDNDQVQVNKSQSNNACTDNNGVLLKTLKPGDIINIPKKGDHCSIHYEVFLEEDMRNKNPIPFDSSRARDETFRFRLGQGQVIEGMDIAVAKMSKGQEVEARIPYQLAYESGYPPVVPPRSTLIFRIELISFSSVV